MLSPAQPAAHTAQGQKAASEGKHSCYANQAYEQAKKGRPPLIDKDLPPAQHAGQEPQDVLQGVCSSGHGRHHRLLASPLLCAGLAGSVRSLVVLCRLHMPIV